MNAQEIMRDSGYPRLKALVLVSTGLAYYRDKDWEVADRVAHRINALALPNCTAYIELLESQPAGSHEMDALIAEFTVGETYFFRHREQFDMLRRTAIPQLLERRRAERALRIWSAGCATGAEPYSVSILLRLEMAVEIAGWEISILGTDINRAFLARAEEGVFDRWALRETPQHVRDTCFDQRGKYWVIRPEYRRGVRFRYHNLVSDAAPAAPGTLAGFDLVLCRNVLIYFDHETMKLVAVKLSGAMAEEGWLVVGHAETGTGVFRSFEAVMEAGVSLYRKPAPGRVERARPPAALPAPGLPHKPAPPSQPAPPAPAAVPSIEEVRQLADRGEWEAGAAKCRMLLAADKLNPAAHFLFGLIMAHTGRDREAERSFRSATYLDRAFAVAWYHLGLLLWKRRALSDAKRAFEVLNHLLDGAPDDQPVEHADGMTAAELRDMARLHLELLGGA